MHIYRISSHLSLSSSKRYSSFLIILVAIINNPKCVSSLSWGAQKETHHCRCGLTSAEHWGGISFLDLVAALPKHPRAPLAAVGARARGWHMFSLVALGFFCKDALQLVEECFIAQADVLLPRNSMSAGWKKDKWLTCGVLRRSRGSAVGQRHHRSCQTSRSREHV